MGIDSRAQPHSDYAPPSPPSMVSNRSFCTTNDENIEEMCIDNEETRIENGDVTGELSYIIHGYRSENDESTELAITILDHGEGGLPGVHSKPQFDLMTELNNCDVWKKACRHLEEKSGPPILLGYALLMQASNSTPGMRLTSAYGDSAYYSGIRQSDSGLILDVNYCLRRNGWPQPKGDPFGHGSSCLTIQFRYNIKNGRATYLLACKDDEVQSYRSLFKDDIRNSKGILHPFVIHLVLLYSHTVQRGEFIEELLRKLLVIEKGDFSSEDWRVTPQNANETKIRLKNLHRLFRDLVIQENNCKGLVAILKRLSKDLERVTLLAQSGRGYKVEKHSHSRIVDSFLYLQDIFQDRAERLATRKERVKNSVAYTYNLLANRDSLTSQRIASESALIAHEARQDSAAMRTMAVLTMFFLPATLVSSLFGTNFFALDTSAPGRPTFVVSELWWIYLVSAIPLTLLTLLSWAVYLKYRETRERRSRKFRALAV